MYCLDHVVFEGLQSRLPVHLRENPGLHCANLLTPSDWSRQKSSDTHQEPLVPEYQRLLQMAGIKPSRYRPAILNRRSRACLRTMSANDFCTAINRLRTQPQLGSAVASSVLLGVSSFFRDTAVYEQLGREVLPGALNRLDGSLRVLSAGCSEGQELYSIAMLLADLGALNKSFLLGMDCRQEALKRAAQGVYPATAIEDVPKTFRGFFEVQGKTVKVKAEIAAPLHWWKADVVDFPPQCTWDLILYRNVAIYLENSPAMEAWQRLMDCLNPGGVLVTGKAERPPDAFALERLGPCIYRKVRDQ